MSPVRRGTGYLHRPVSLAERAASVWRGLEVAAGCEPSVHPPFPELFRRFGPLDQASTEACTGFGVAMGATLQSVADGMERTVPLSPVLPYWAARRRRVVSDDLVRDEGAFVEDVVWAFNRFGAVDDVLRLPSAAGAPDARSWAKAFEELVYSTINQRPALGEFRAALRLRSQLQLRMQRIVDDPMRQLERLAYALHQGQVCFLALPVADSFMDPAPGVIPKQPLDRLIGYHFVCVLDWRRVGGGLFELLCGNSWGDWAQGGTAWLSAELCMQARWAGYLERLPGVEVAA